MFRHHHPEVQSGMGELQELQPRRHRVRRYSCPHGGSIPLPNPQPLVNRGGFTEGLSDAETQ